MQLAADGTGGSFVNFGFTEEREMLRDQVVRFIDDECSIDVIRPFEHRRGNAKLGLGSRTLNHWYAKAGNEALAPRMTRWRVARLLSSKRK